MSEVTTIVMQKDGRFEFVAPGEVGFFEAAGFTVFINPPPIAVIVDEPYVEDFVEDPPAEELDPEEELAP